MSCSLDEAYIRVKTLPSFMLWLEDTDFRLMLLGTLDVNAYLEDTEMSFLGFLRLAFTH